MSCCTGDFVSVHHWEHPLDAEICPNEPLSHPGRDRSSATKNRRQVPIGPATPPDQSAATLRSMSPRMTPPQTPPTLAGLPGPRASAALGDTPCCLVIVCVLAAAAVWRCLARQSAPEPFEGRTILAGGARRRRDPSDRWPSEGEVGSCGSWGVVSQGFPCWGFRGCLAPSQGPGDDG